MGVTIAPMGVTNDPPGELVLTEYFRIAHQGKNNHNEQLKNAA
jgi:hypothetical protein